MAPVSPQYATCGVGRTNEMDYEDDYENRWRPRIPARTVRASSAIPGSFGHYDDLATTNYDNWKQSRSRRGVSEERELVRNETYVPEYSFEDGTKTRLDDIKALLARESGRDDADLFEGGSKYQITIKPKSTSSWIRPNRFYYNTNSQSAATSALLEAYQPSNFPDFSFGSSGRLSGRPISLPYTYRSPQSTNRFTPAPGATSYGIVREIPIRREPSHNYGYLAAPRDYIPKPRSRYTYRPEPEDYEPEDYVPRSTYSRPTYSRPRYNPRFEDDEFYKAPSKINRLSKFFHYYIPKQYGGTPMLGGYLLSTGPVDYTWKY